MRHTRQGEAITYAADGATFMTSSEGSGTDTNPESGVLDRYVRAAAPPPIVPEAPPWLVPLAAAAVLGLVATRRRGARLPTAGSRAPVVPR